MSDIDLIQTPSDLTCMEWDLIDTHIKIGLSDRDQDSKWKSEQIRLRLERLGFVVLRKVESQKYVDLLHSVETVFPGESRHETALRYIREAENGQAPPQQNAKAQGDGTPGSEL